jgi:hypothetical protein
MPPALPAAPTLHLTRQEATLAGLAVGTLSLAGLAWLAASSRRRTSARPRPRSVPAAPAAGPVAADEAAAAAAASHRLVRRAVEM